MTALKVEIPPTFPKGEEASRRVDKDLEREKPKRRFADRLRLMWRAWLISFFGSFIFGYHIGSIDAGIRRRLEDKAGYRRTIWNAPKRWVIDSWWWIYCFAKGWFAVFIYFHYELITAPGDLTDSAETAQGSLWGFFVDCPVVYGQSDRSQK